VLLGSGGTSIAAQGKILHGGEDHANLVFNLDLFKDSALLGSGLLLNGIDYYIEKFSEHESRYPAEKPDSALINPIDRLFLFPYSKTADRISSLLTYSVLVSPLVLLGTPQQDWLTVGVMYGEALLFSRGLKELGKNLVRRERPYCYFDNCPSEVAAAENALRSFPSGHATLSFTAAVFSSFVFATYYPDSPWKIPIQAAVWSFAITSALLRVASGNHFLSDIAAGAGIGILSGYLIPYIHLAAERHSREWGAKNKAFTIGVTAHGIVVGWSY
jgi:undecaprenyl-diphosphatase